MTKWRQKPPAPHPLLIIHIFYYKYTNQSASLGHTLFYSYLLFWMGFYMVRFPLSARDKLAKSEVLGLWYAIWEIQLEIHHLGVFFVGVGYPSQGVITSDESCRTICDSDQFLIDKNIPWLLDFTLKAALIDLLMIVDWWFDIDSHFLPS